MAKTAQTLEIDAIERLEDKVKKLVTMVEHMRADHARLSAENKSLNEEAGTLRKRLVDAEGASTEVTALRSERDQIRTRVSDMLTQLEALDL